jgi:hypothetical protein
MPLVDFKELEDTEWTKDATRLLDISLYPLDDMFIIDYYEAHPTTIEEQRDRLRGFNQISISVSIIFFITLYNLKNVKSLVLKRPKVLASWCCLLTTLTCLCMTILLVFCLLGIAINYRILMWTCGVLSSIVTMSSCTILAIKICISLDKPRWILGINIILVSSQLVIPYIIMKRTRSTVEEYYGCSFV